MKILSIDPGYDRLGVAVIEVNEAGTMGKARAHRDAKKETLLFSDCVETPKKWPHEKRLQAVGEAVARIIEEWQPGELAIEELFFSENKKSALLVAQAFGVVLFEAAKKDIPVFLYKPAEIKIAVTSHGRSDKSQVIAMVKRLITISKEKALDDEYDAIAVGLTHAASRASRRLSTI